ncbi:MAG: glycosyltransferase, partial [Actinomycetota bacterium]
TTTGRIDQRTERRIDRWTRAVGSVEDSVVIPLSRRSVERLEREFATKVDAARVSEVMARNLRIGAVVDQLEPDVVFANHMVQRGLAGALVRTAPRIAMPWGGDIFNIGPTTALTRHLVRTGLRHAELVMPSAESAVPDLRSRWGVDPRRIRALSWGVDVRLFSPALADERADLRRALSVPDGAKVVFNTRRFKHAWGAKAVIDAGIRLAQNRPEVLVVNIAGAGNNAELAEAAARVEHHGLSDRFRFIRGEVSLADYATWSRIADVGLALKQTPDMRSLSILQPAHAGAWMIVSDQPEYREMAQIGLTFDLVDPDNSDVVVRSIEDALDATADEHRRRADGNRQVVAEHEDHLERMSDIVDTIESVAESGRSVRTPRAYRWLG